MASRAAPARFDVARALKDAALAALITAGLAFPILALRAEPDIDNRLTLQGRWSWLFITAAIVFAGRFLLALLDIRPRRKPATDEALPPSVYRAARFIGPAGLALLFVFPLAVFAALGPQGSLKWIDNYGIQILIYVMLGWGLNIVVGLAGLLDLGYVAFYAVGAYAYTLLAIEFDLSFWICLPIAGVLAALWGMTLGFPVLRLRGDYLAIVTLAFGEIIRTILINWTSFSGGSAGISSIPKITFFGLVFADRDNGFDNYFGMDYSPIHGKLFLYYVLLVLSLITNLVTLRLRRLPIGRHWEALRDDE